MFVIPVVTVPVFDRDPTVTSPAVGVYVAVQVSDAIGASILPGQVTALRLGMGSVTATEGSVTLPVFVTL